MLNLIAVDCEQINPCIGDMLSLTFYPEKPEGLATHTIWIKQFSPVTVTYGWEEGVSNFFPYPAMSDELLGLLPLEHEAKQFWVLLNRLS